MIDRLAVIIAGEFRTWDQVCPYTFNFFQNAATQIDYFFATWNIDTSSAVKEKITQEQITATFLAKSQNLIDYQLVDPIGLQRTTFYNLAWLSKIGNIMKRQAEIKGNFIYDQVVETRPDIYLRKKHSNYIWPSCTDHTYTGIGAPADSPANMGFLALHDVYYRTNSFTNDIISNRFSFRHQPEHFNNSFFSNYAQVEHHTFIVHYFYENMLRPFFYEDRRNDNGYFLDRDFIWEICVRPNVPKTLDLDQASFKELQEYNQQWGRQHDFFQGGFGSAIKRPSE